MNENNYYRIVYFKKNKFPKIVITNDNEKIKQLIESHTSNIEIYKCNSKGNNYTGRKIYPLFY